MTTRVVLSSLGGINELRRPSPPHTHGGGAGGFGLGSPIRKHISIIISHFLSMFSIFLYIYVLPTYVAGPGAVSHPGTS